MNDDNPEAIAAILRLLLVIALTGPDSATIARNIGSLPRSLAESLRNLAEEGCKQYQFQLSAITCEWAVSPGSIYSMAEQDDGKIEMVNCEPLLNRIENLVSLN